MEISSYPSGYVDKPTTSTQEAIAVTPMHKSYQRRSVWVFAKRIFRKRLLFSKRCRNRATESLELTEVATGQFQSFEENSQDISQATVQRLLDPVLQQVFPYLDIYDRLRLREVPCSKMMNFTFFFQLSFNALIRSVRTIRLPPSALLSPRSVDSNSEYRECEFTLKSHRIALGKARSEIKIIFSKTTYA